MKRKRVTKGHYGYIEYRKRSLFIQGGILMAGTVGLVVLGISITGSTKNLLSLAGIMTAIPMIMQFVQLIAIAKYHTHPEEEYEQVKALAGDGILDTDLVIANKDGESFDVPYAYVHSSGIIILCETPKIDTDKTEEYIRNYLRLNSCDAPLTVVTELRVFMKRLKTLSPESRESAPDELLRQEGVLRAISM